MKIIQREEYLGRLMTRRNNGMIKVITGLRRSGKSFLLHTIFTQRLIDEGILPENIRYIDLENWINRDFRNPDFLYRDISEWANDPAERYLLLDEVQMLEHFEEVLNGLMKLPGLDIYVTGSNARFLSTDVITEFRGRGDEMRIHTLSFKEFMSAYEGDKISGLQEYMLYGGLPQAVGLKTDEQKVTFLKNLYRETYLRDICERHNITKDAEFEELAKVLASTVGSLTNPFKIANTFKSEKKVDLSHPTINAWIDYFRDAFMLERARRYDINGREYINSPYKYYFADLGLQNALLNFHRIQPGHMMESIIYNELRNRGYNVDVGLVSVRNRDNAGKQIRNNFEVDFIAHLGSEKYYIQAAWQMDTPDKEKQEITSLKHIGNSFKKIMITGDVSPRQNDENGIIYVNIYDFLLDNSLLRDI